MEPDRATLRIRCRPRRPGGFESGRSIGCSSPRPHPVSLIPTHGRIAEGQHAHGVRGAKFATLVAVDFGVLLKLRRRCEEGFKRRNRRGWRGKTDEVQPGQGPSIRGQHGLPFHQPVIGSDRVGHFHQIRTVAGEPLQRRGGAEQPGPSGPLGASTGGDLRGVDELAGRQGRLPIPDFLNGIGQIAADELVESSVGGINVEEDGIPSWLERIRLGDPLGVAPVTPTRHDREDKPGEDAGGESRASRGPRIVVTHKYSPELRREISDSFRGTLKNYFEAPEGAQVSAVGAFTGRARLPPAPPRPRSNSTGKCHHHPAPQPGGGHLDARPATKRSQGHRARNTGVGRWPDRGC